MTSKSAKSPVADALARGPRRGSVTLPYNEREVSASWELSGHFDRGPPRAHRRSAKHAFRLG